MRRMFIALSLSTIAFSGGGAVAAERTIVLAVDNMYCAACPYIVEQSLTKAPGVINVTVSFEKKTASVTYDDQATTPAELMHVTTEAGYPSQVIP